MNAIDPPVFSLLPWAEELMASRPMDYNIGPDYMHRWWVIPRNEQHNTYLHRILRSDDDRALHDHPWDNQSIILKGRYVEHTPEGEFLREAGYVGFRKATDSHRLQLIEGDEPVISLFITGPKVREWGFHCPNGWRHWKEFVSTSDQHNATKGRGCE